MKSLITYIQAYPILHIAVWIHLITLAMSLVGLGIDERTLINEPIWLKPMKFSLSILIYLVTVAWLLHIYPYSNKIKSRIASGASLIMIIEIVLVVMQAFRGVRSHFNESNAFDGSVFGIMGLLILANSIILVFMIITAFASTLQTTTYMQRAVQLGWIGMLVSMVSGVVMVSAMSHSVGIADGSDGIPITKWSIEGGDWRAVHFFGFHAIQLLPLLAYALTTIKWEASWIELCIWIVGLSYLGLCAYIYWRTMNGQPFLPFIAKYVQ